MFSNGDKIRTFSNEELAKLVTMILNYHHLTSTAGAVPVKKWIQVSVPKDAFPNPAYSQ